MSSWTADAPRSSLLTLHWRLIAGERTDEEIAAVLLARLRRTLRGRLPRVSPEVVDDAVADAILKYLHRPSIYEPAKGALDTFLTIVALRLALSAVRREALRHRVEIAFDEDRHAAEAAGGVGRIPVAMRWLMKQVAATPAEQAFVLARLDGEHRTTPLAALLGAADLSVEEQRRLVKRTTERVRLRAKRLVGRA